ncbi:MAG: orotidine-5'-phosphate decarboxylase [Bacteroidales bacterium]|nr:orotidine-5'-phosphate decarboxylase [Bacteroidales bacterium]MCF8328079.1 orotidine-5'-phosphate decarboxylase [Bacteroidales bacterium]
MKKSDLVNLIKSKHSFLCIGLDSDIQKIPKHLLKADDPVFEFNKQIIDATIDLAVAYKPNIAFYESRGSEGWQSLEKTIDYIHSKEEDVFTIADAKRGDIGNSSKYYAETFLSSEKLDFDAVTVSPYMGRDSVEPFLQYDGKYAIVLALTSNPGASDFQLPRHQLTGGLEKLGIKTQNRRKLWEQVLIRSYDWGTEENMMFVVGATKAEMLEKIRSIIPYHFLLVPGIGAQGGSLEEVAHYGLTHDCGLLVNSSRGIIFASEGEDFAQHAREKAQKIQKKMDFLLKEKGVTS